MAEIQIKPMIKISPGRPASSNDSGATGALRVSVIIPTFNGEDSLPRCLNALMAQDFPKSDFEIVVVDDGSTDGTAGLVKDFEGRTPSVKYIYQVNHGPASARNNGANNARGEIIMFTDDDCEPQRNWISEMVKPFASPEVDAVKGAYKTRQESVIAHFAQTEFETRYDKLLNSQFVDFVDTYAAAFKRSVFLELGGFDTSFPLANNEDVDFSYRLSERGHKIVFNREAIVYHTHPDTLFRYLRVKFGRAYWRMAVYRKFPGKMKSDSYTPQTLKIQIALTFMLVVSLIAEYVLKRPFHISIVVGALFLLSALPFMVSVINLGFVNRFISFMKRFLKRGFIRAILARIKTWYSRSLIHAILAGIFRLLGRITGALLSVIRKCIGCRLSMALFGLTKRTCVLIGKTGLWLIKALWFAVCLPWKILVAVCGALRQMWRSFRKLKPVKAVFSALNWIGRTRLVMIPLSIAMLFLRAAAMGLGILWGLQSQTSRKGRFVQVFLLLMSDVLGVVGAFFAAYYMRKYLLAGLLGFYDHTTHIYLEMLPPVIVFQLSVFFLLGLYKPYRGFSQVTEFTALVKAAATIMLVVVVVQYLISAPHAKSVVLMSAFLALVFVTVLRWISRSFCTRFLQNTPGGDISRVLLIGTGEIARLVCRRLKTGIEINSFVVGMVDPDPALKGQKIDGYEILGGLDDISSIVQVYNIHEVFVALPMLAQQEVMNLVDKHSGKDGVHFYVISNLFDLISAELDIAEHSNIPIACFRNEQMALLHLLVKRLFDLAVSGAVILLTFPFWVVIMIAIRLETDGPAIFQQARVGKDGKEFQIYKFRTMRVDTPKYEMAPTASGDARITKVGAFLRKTSLDEFPQFLNVFKGNMSLVGPRPEMPFIVEKYKDWERQRLKVKPGLTGLWQIMGRKELPLHESLEYDFYYIKNQSLLLDITILIKTIPIVILGKGAY